MVHLNMLNFIVPKSAKDIGWLHSLGYFDSAVLQYLSRPNTPSLDDVNKAALSKK